MMETGRLGNEIHYKLYESLFQKILKQNGITKM